MPKPHLRNLLRQLPKVRVKGRRGCASLPRRCFPLPNVRVAMARPGVGYCCSPDRGEGDHVIVRLSHRAGGLGHDEGVAGYMSGATSVGCCSQGGEHCDARICHWEPGCLYATRLATLRRMMANLIAEKNWGYRARRCPWIGECPAVSPDNSVGSSQADAWGRHANFRKPSSFLNWSEARRGD